MPAFMERDPVRIAFGVMGGFNQPVAQVQFVSNVADYDMNIQAALEAARFTMGDTHGLDVRVEDRIPAATMDALSRLGHRLDVCGSYSNAMGRGQAVLLHADRSRCFAASDPRGDGCGEPAIDPFRAVTPPMA